MNVIPVDGGVRIIAQCLLLLGLAFGGGSLAWSASANIRADLWMVDGVVNAAVLDESAPAKPVLYIGGDFNYVGPRTGGGAVLKTSDARANTAFPVIEGIVNAAVTDGLGGWYIGGDFTSVGGVARNNIAYIKLDNVGQPVVADWNPDVNGIVYALALNSADALLYIGGNFTKIDSTSVLDLMSIPPTPAPTTRNHIAALDTTVSVAGSYATAWDPDVDGTVYAMTLNDAKLYIGGNFTRIDSTSVAPAPTTRNHIAALDTTVSMAGSYATAWDPDTNGVVYALAYYIKDDHLYVGGDFTTIDSTSVAPAPTTRNHIAALDTTKSVAGSYASAWNPDANGVVRTLAFNGNSPQIFIGGDFTTVGGITHRAVAKVETVSGVADSVWKPDLNVNAIVNTLVVTGARVYIGGAFTELDSSSTPSVNRNNIAAVDVTFGAVLSWNANANAAVNVIAFDGSALYAGGGFYSIGRITRNRLAALNLLTGEAKQWDPDIDNIINTMVIEGGTLYIGGLFTSIDSSSVTPAPVTRNYMAALDVNATAVGSYAKPWNPNVNGEVHTMAVSADKATLFVGGNFTSLGVDKRDNIAGINMVKGGVTPWNPGSDGIVRSIVPKSNGFAAYVGGDFSLIGSEPRAGLAELLLISGTASSWNPGDLNNPVPLGTNSVGDLVLSQDEGSLYVADYTSGTTNKGVARVNTAVEPDGSVILSWLADADGRVNTIAIDNNEKMLYAGGDFLKLSGQPADGVGVARYDLQGDGVTGAITSWDLKLDASVSRLLFSGNGATLYAAGSFTTAGGQLTRSGVAAFSLPIPDISADPAGDGFNVEQNVTLTCTDNSGSNVYAIYYTDDGFEPTKSSNEILATVPVASFSTDILVASIKTLKFFCVDYDGNRSEVVTESYIIDNQIPVVTVSLNSGAYGASTTSVRLFCSDGSGQAGCDKIYYTLDGTVPTTSSKLYTGAILLTSMLSLDTTTLSQLTLADFPSVDTSRVTVPLDTVYLSDLIKDNPTAAGIKTALDLAEKSGWITLENILPISFVNYPSLLSDPGLAVTTLAGIDYAEVPSKYKVPGVSFPSILLGSLTLADFPDVDTSSVTAPLDSIKLSDLLFNNTAKASLVNAEIIAENAGWITLDQIPIDPQRYQEAKLNTTLNQLLISEVPENYLTIKIILNAIAFDRAGNSSDQETRVYDIDYAPPVITANFESGLYTPPITLVFTCDGGRKSSSSSCDKVYYKTGGQSPVFSSVEGGTRSIIPGDKDLLEYTTPLVLDRGVFFRIVGVDELGNVGVPKSFIYAFSEDHRDDTKVGLGSFGPMMLLFILFGLVMRRRRIYINAGSASCR